MKKISAFLIALLCALILAAPCAYSQDREKEGTEGTEKTKIEKMKQGRMGDMMKALKLDDMQLEQLIQLREKHLQDTKEIMSGMSTKIRNCLTPDQQAIWDKKTSAKGGAEKGALKGLLKELNIDENQKSTIVTVLKDERAKLQASREAYMGGLKEILKPEQFEKFTELKEKAEKFKEQGEKFKEKMKERRELKEGGKEKPVEKTGEGTEQEK
ncbi:MAG: hypothetical protein RDV48_23715 [Candidatus Eremiobacteraeota bacterium]|nr:hypothetical protein [Candidatus Eremiobacteraeota bacterium]